MSDSGRANDGSDLDRPGRTRTWWHPLFARLLERSLATAYRVFEEVSVGKLPLRVDVLLIRRETGQLSEEGRSSLAALLPLLNRFTLIELKAPTDTLEQGDLAQLLGCAFLWHSQQSEPIPAREISLIVLAPTINTALRRELRSLAGQTHKHESGIYHISGFPFATWLIETDVMGERVEPVLSLVSRAFLRDRGRIIEQLAVGGHLALLYYMLQQVQQFRLAGEGFAMQHKDSQHLQEVEEELLTSVLAAVPAERRLRGLKPEDFLRGLSPEELLAGLSEEQATRLRELLDKKSGS